MKSCWVNRLGTVVLLALLIGGRPLCAQQPPEQKFATLLRGNVQEIRIIDETGKVRATTPPGIAVKIGEPLDRDAVAASIRALYNTGDYANIAAIETPQSNGVRLDFVVQENMFINQVVILGLKPPPTEATAAGAMQLSLGQTYRPGDVQDAVNRLKDTLQEEGLYQAKITVEKQAHTDTRQLDILVQVQPGARVRLSKVSLQNNTEYSDSELLKLFKLRPGRELTVARGQSATARIRKFLEKNGHLSDRVALRRGEYNAADNTIPLTLDVIAGPLVRVAIVGAKFSTGDLRRLIPTYWKRANGI